MEQIRFVLDRFFYGWKMNALVFDKNNQILDFCIGDKEKFSGDYKDEYGDLFLANADSVKIFSVLKEKSEQAKIPIVHVEEDDVYYLAFKDKDENLYVFGPASADDLSFAQQITYRKKHHVSGQKYMVPKVALAKALNGLVMVYYMITGIQVTETEIMQKSQIYVDEDMKASEMAIYEIKNTTEEKQHLAYQDEVRWTQAIENGVLEKTEARMTPENLEKVEKIGTLASTNSLKQFEYMAVTACCLASRAAIRGGVNAYEAYQTSEMFLQKISKCTNVMEVLQIHMEISGTFSELVRQVKENRNSDCVEQCKDYIARHRSKKFSLSDVAEAVGKNPSYLSRVFSEQTGMTMQDYALNSRLEAAANMLRFSNESIGEVAEYLCFPSQSYFGERFKKKYGVTPAAYRKQNKIRDFKE